jgi:hypothetical protein
LGCGSKLVGIVLLNLPLSALMRHSSASFNPQTQEGMCIDYYLRNPHFFFASGIVLVAV